MWLLTHFIPQPVEEDAWVEVTFFTRRDGEAGYFCGFDPDGNIPDEEMQDRVEVGAAEPLSVPVQITEDKAVWIAPNADIWVADEDQPIDDYKKVRVKKSRIEPVSRSILERVTTPKDEHEGIRELVTLNKHYVRKGGLYEQFIARVILEIRDKLGIEVNELDDESSILWDNIALSLDDGCFDFCYDPYFKTVVRGRIVDVVQFGIVDKVTFYVAAKVQVARTIVRCHDAGMTLLQTLVELHNRHRDLLIGVLGACVSTSEVNRQIRSVLGVKSRIKHWPDEVKLRHWIEEDPVNRVIVGDIGLVPMLKRVGKAAFAENKLPELPSFNKTNFIGNEPDLLFPMEMSYPVGLVYPIGDERWRTEIVDAFRKTIIATVGTLAWENGEQSIARELEEVGVQCFAFSELCERFGAPEAYARGCKLKSDVELAEEIKRLVAEQKAAVESENYELAATFQNQIERIQTGSESKVGREKDE